MNQTKEEVKTKPIKVSCGANSIDVDVYATTVGELRNQLREALNITNDHTIVTVNGQQLVASDPNSHPLYGGEELEFKKPAGEKGQN